MLITNISKAIRGFHDKSGRAVLLQPGEERNVDIDAGTQALLARMSDGYRLGGGTAPAQEEVPTRRFVQEEIKAPEHQPRRGRPRRSEG